MGDLSTTQVLWIVNGYALLALSLFALSGSDLLCRLRQDNLCARRHRIGRLIVAVVLGASCLAIFAAGLFAIGVSHGSGPKTYQVVLFSLGCLLPIILLIIWIVGSLLVDILWCVTVLVLAAYLTWANPALYIRYWADDSHQWAQMWIARNYEAGGGGLNRSMSSALTWYQKAAENGNREAQYRIGQNQRRSSNARKWYLLAAKQGHLDAMIEVARLAVNKEERRAWLNRAAGRDHPEALSLLARDAMLTDLPTARKLLLEAAEYKSRSAIILLIEQYQKGGILFDQNQPLAGKWRTILQNTPPSESGINHLSTLKIEQKKTTARDMGGEMGAGDPELLYKQAKVFLSHPAKDKVLHDRAIAYLMRAADSGHGEAAVELAKLTRKNNQPLGNGNREALHWLEIAAINDNRDALKQLTEYYKGKPDANIDDLGKSLEYNLRLLKLMEKDTGSRQNFQRQHWSAEYRNTQHKHAQLHRLGGSWQEAVSNAENSSEKEYLLAKELIASNNYENGMKRMQSAAERGSPAARFELARQVLYGPRSFTEEIKAISELQQLDLFGFLPASLQLGMLYQSGTGVVPKNLYLARKLFHKVQGDEALSEKALYLLENTPGFTDTLQINPEENPQQAISRWYKQAVAKEKNNTVVHQQYEILLVHYSDIEHLRQMSEENDAQAQYELAQSLQSYNLVEAIQWLERAALQGHSKAQYELAVRMIDGKKNTMETQQSMRRWAFTAAENGHVGAMIFIGNNMKNGYGGFEINRDQAEKYYTLALQSVDGDVLFEGKIAGRAITIKRSTVQKTISELRREK